MAKLALHAWLLNLHSQEERELPCSILAVVNKSFQFLLFYTIIILDSP